MNQEQIIIRKAEEADYEAVNHLYHLSYSLYHENMPAVYKKTPATVLKKGDFLNILQDDRTRMFVAEAEGKVVGHIYAMIETFDEDEMAPACERVEVAEISIEPAYARMGIGTRLMKEVEKWAKEKKITDLQTLVYDFNKDGIAFYEANGYKPYSIKIQKKL